MAGLDFGTLYGLLAIKAARNIIDDDQLHHQSAA